MLRHTNFQLCCMCLITIGVNFVSCASDNSLWHSYQFGTGHGNREELIITNVVTDEKFNLGRDVLRWQSISSANKVYAVGLMKGGVNVLLAEPSPDKRKFVATSKITEFDATFTDLELFEHWNEESGIPEIILIAASSGANPEIMWFKIVNNNLEHIWTWHIHKNASHLRFFKSEDDKNNLLILNPNTADLYEFILGHDFWFFQALKLSTPADNSAINTFGSDLYISIPQPAVDSILIYKLTDHRIQLYQNLSNSGVSRLNSFKIGFKSFLAIGGESAGIYRFTKKGLVREDITGLNLDNVDFWLPVPVKTYRDEVVLMLQRSLNHGTHKSLFLEVVVYDGVKFVSHEEISCTFFGETGNGLACMVDDEGDQGLLGAAVLALGSTLGVLVPRKDNSGLFMVYTAMRRLKSPVELEIEKLAETRKKLQQMMDEQQAHIQSINDRLQNSIKLNESNTISAPWKLQTLSTPSIEESSHTIVTRQSAKEISLEELKNQTEKLRIAIQSAKKKLQNTVLLNKGENRFDELIVDGRVEVRGETKANSVQVEKFNDEPVHEAFNDLVKKRDINAISGHKTFTNMEVENVTFEVLNGVDADQIIMNTDPIFINRSVVFDEPVKVLGEVTVMSGQINDLDLAEEVVEMNKKCEGTLTFEHVVVDAAQANNLPTMTNDDIDIRGGARSNGGDGLELDVLQISGNITVEDVNGENFDEFLRSLCFINVATYIPGKINITGNLTAEDIDVAALNELKFPEEYVLNGADYSEIYGKKIFEGAVFGNEVTVEGTVNGMDLESIITLTSNQSSPATFTFHELEVTEGFNVEGSIDGPYISNFLENPTLHETTEIKAKVNFKFLEVEGNVIVGEKLNGLDFGETLNDVVYEDDEVATISSIKDFLGGFTVLNGIYSASDLINTIHISSFVTKNTEQTMVMQSLNGHVTFENLLLGGLYGDINITQLEQDTVKLTGEQFISSTLIFDNNDDSFLDFSAVEFQIVNTLNNLTVDDYWFTTGESRTLHNPANFGNLQAENVVVEGELSGHLEDFSVEDFEARRLSLTKFQTVTAPYSIKNLDAGSLKAGTVNGEVFEDFFNYEHYADKISQMLVEGKLKITNLQVGGSVFVDNISGHDIKNLSKSCVWMDKNNNFPATVFYRDVSVSDLNLLNFNGVNFKILSDNIIYKTETSPTINAFKTFTNGFYVTRMLNSERLNDIHVDDILTRTGSQHLAGPLNIHGNVLINSDCEIYDNLNDISVEYLAQTYQFAGDTCTINDDLVMDRLPYINRLEVEGFANDDNLEEFLSNLVYKSENVKILGKVTFENAVRIQQNMAVTQKINNIDLSEFVQDIVLITNDDVIESLVTFTQPVHISEQLTIDSNLDTRYLIGIDLSTWNKNAVFINRGLILGKLTFQTVTIQGEVSLNYINDVDLSELIPLRTDQVIDQKMFFSEIMPFNDIRVGNYVNGYEMVDEYRNSLLVSGDIQTVATRVVFTGTVLVRDNLQILGLINGNKFSSVVTTHTSQNLTAAYEFTGRVQMDRGIRLFGLLNNIDLLEWSGRAVRTYMDRPQEVDDVWVVFGNITFNENVGGNGLIRDLDLRTLAEEVESKRLLKFYTEGGLMDDYRNVCRDVNNILDKAKNQIYLFKYLEKLQTLQIDKNINNVLHFKHLNQNYVLLSESESCMSHLFLWTESGFQPIRQIETGNILQFISVYDGDLVFLLGRSRETLYCPIFGTNLWKFDNENIDLIHLYTLVDQQLLQESMVPGAFYGLSGNLVTEYRIVTVIETDVRKYRKWTVDAENLAFVPRGLGTGLALSNGLKLFRLLREDPVIEIDFDFDTDAFIVGEVIVADNLFLPGYYGDDILVMNVGAEEQKRSLVAVASHEETSVIGRLDFIKIYENILTGKVFHKVPTYKPSSLVSLEFDNGETLLIFLEDEKTLQVYEYKGIEGFKHRTSAKLEGSKLMTMSVPTKPGEMETRVIGVVNGNKINLIQAVMAGHHIVMEKSACEL